MHDITLLVSECISGANGNLTPDECVDIVARELTPLIAEMFSDAASAGETITAERVAELIAKHMVAQSRFELDTLNGPDLTAA